MKKVILFLILIILVFGTSGCLYEKKETFGNRIDNSNKVSQEKIEELEEWYESISYIKDCDISVIGKIMRIKIHFTDDTELKMAKLRCSGGPGEEFDYYDIMYEIYNKNFHVTGLYNRDYISITWSDTK